MRDFTRRPTVLDVAKSAGVAPSTVSRCLRGGSYVSADVRRRVSEAVRLLRYEPNDIARSLRGDRTKSIGVIFPQIANPYFGRCVQQIELEATRRGYSVVLLTHQEDHSRQSDQLAVLRRTRVDGVILTAAPGSNMETVREELTGVPVVALDRPLWEDSDVIMLQHRISGRRATQHLLDHGHTVIACVTANANVYSFSERVAGYTGVMDEAGLDTTLIEAPDYETLQSLVTGRLLGPSPPSAILSLSSMASVVTLLAEREVFGFQKQVATIGFDDVELAPLVSPPMTVLSQPTDQMARQSVALLFQRIHERTRSAVQRIELCAEFVLRESCGCPPLN